MVVTAAVMVCYFLATASDTLLGDILFILTLGTPIFGIPLACAVAVLRYRLYDLDVVVKKTSGRPALVAAGFHGHLRAAGGRGRRGHRPAWGSSPLTFVVAALAALMLQPIRARALLADRLVYGRRATPDEVLSEFSERMAGTYSTEDVLPRMARMLAEATGAQRAEVWLRTAGREHLAGAWPSPNGPGARGSQCQAGANLSRSGRSGAGHQPQPEQPIRSRARRCLARAHPGRRPAIWWPAARTAAGPGPLSWSIRASASARCGSPAHHGSR